MNARLPGRLAALISTALLAIIWTPALARTTAIDDSGTTVLEPSVSLRWKQATPGHGADGMLLVGHMTARVRLNLRPWLHRRARIYLALPTQPPGPLTARFTTTGRLYPGAVASGSRVLVYQGSVTAPELADDVTFELVIDGRVVRRPFPVNFRFEMDED